MLEHRCAVDVIERAHPVRQRLFQIVTVVNAFAFDSLSSIDSPFEPPERPDLVLDGASADSATLADQLYEQLFGLATVYAI